MTPKEKANQLVNKFSTVGLQQRNEGIACALIAVDEILSAIPNEYLDCWQGESQMILNEDIDYWQEVKTEIERL